MAQVGCNVSTTGTGKVVLHMLSADVGVLSEMTLEQTTKLIDLLNNSKKMAEDELIIEMEKQEEMTRHYNKAIISSDMVH